MPTLTRRHALTFGLAALAPAASPARAATPPVEVPFVKRRGNLWLPATINGKLTLDFALDSGAADVSLPAHVLADLRRMGLVGEDDLLGLRQHSLADGTKRKVHIFRLRSLAVGTREVHDLLGSSGDTEGPPLLGQSYLGRLDRWSVDNHRQMLVLE
jgi:predicted aspartyl protease